MIIPIAIGTSIGGSFNLLTPDESTPVYYRPHMGVLLVYGGVAGWVWIKIKPGNGPQVLVHVSIYQGKPFWVLFEKQPYGGVAGLWGCPISGFLVGIEGTNLTYSVTVWEQESHQLDACPFFSRPPPNGGVPSSNGPTPAMFLRSLQNKEEACRCARNPPSVASCRLPVNQKELKNAGARDAGNEN